MTPEAWTAGCLGRQVHLHPAVGAHGRVQTWLVEGDNGDLLAVLRWGLAKRKFAQECVVAQEVWPRLTAAPALLHTEPAHGALLRTAVRGAAGATERPALEAAARAVAALHTLPLVDEDPVALADAVGLRAAAAAHRLIGEPLVADALRLVDAGRAFVGAARVWCHRDLQPDNWVWDGCSVGLVDWEHSRPDALELDLAHLVPTPSWPTFHAHYGPVDEDRLRAAVALHGLVTLAWGRRHGDAAFATRGRDALECSVAAWR